MLNEDDTMMSVSAGIFLTGSCPEKLCLSSAQEQTVSSKKIFMKSCKLWSNNTFSICAVK